MVPERLRRVANSLRTTGDSSTPCGSVKMLFCEDASHDIHAALRLLEERVILLVSNVTWARPPACGKQWPRNGQLT